MSNCLNFSMLFKTSLGSINGGESESNIITAKKVTLPDGRSLPYLSGQCIRRMLKERFAEMGEVLSPINAPEAQEQESRKRAKSPDFTSGDPATYIDDDLLGYLQAEKKEVRRRTAPVRASAAVGLFPYAGDRDYGTRSKEASREEVTEEGGQKLTGNIFETEIYYNIFRTTLLVELDRVGVFQPWELGKLQDLEGTRDETERRRRVRVLAEAILNLWGGGKQSRLLTDLGPKLLIYTRQSRKNPILLEALMMDDQQQLQIQPLVEALSDYRQYLDKVIVGVRTGFISDEQKNQLQEELTKVNGLADKLTFDSIGKASLAIFNDIDQMELPQSREV